nr:MAG TPA: major capsid protein [Caudoviricetes sp.]
MAVNLAQKYSDKLDQVFSHGSYTDDFVNKNYDFDGVKTVNVYTATTVALKDYDRTATGDRYGGNNELQDVLTPYTLTKDRTFKLTIDDGNAKQQVMAKRAGAIMKAQLQEQVAPEIDKYRIAVAATGANAVNQKITATAGKAYLDVLKMSEFLDEAQAPVAGRVLYVTPKFYTMIKDNIVTTTHGSEYVSKLIGRGFVGELDGVPVVKVPTSYMPTKTYAVMWHKDAILGAKQIFRTRIIPDSELVDGTVLTGRFLYDAFVLSGKKNAVASVVYA